MLDPQLVCYSWITGISDVAQVVFVRKRLVEIQYFRTTITDEQREEFGQLVEDTVRRIEVGPVPAPQRRPVPAEPLHQLSLCRPLPGASRIWSTASLVRRPGDDRGLFDELDY